MRNKTTLAAACGVMLLTGALCFGQSDNARPDQPKYFHLDFLVKELDNGKVVNARHYTTSTSTVDYNGTIRSGSKVPVPATSSGTDSAFTYIDVGVNIDCRNAKQIQNDLALNVTSDISTAVPGPKQPVIRQTRWSANVIVPIGQPTVIFSSDDVAGKGQMQLELTATAIQAH